MARQIQFGLRIDSNEPVDSRFTVATQAARFALPDSVLYEGLETYQQDTNTFYVCTNPNADTDAGKWTERSSGTNNSDFTGGVVVLTGNGQAVEANQIAYVSDTESYVNISGDEITGVTTSTNFTTDADWVRINSGGNITASSVSVNGGSFLGNVDIDSTTGAGGITVAADTNDPNNITLRLVDDAITTVKLANDVVTNAKIADNAIQNAQLANDAVSTAEIADDAVTGAKIADDSIGSEHIIDNAVLAAAINSNAVTTAKIADSAVTGSKIPSNAITSAKIANDAVTSAKIANNAVGSSEIASGAVGTAKIADDAVTADKLADTTVTAGSYTNTSITVDAQGRITSASTGAVGGATNVSVNGGVALGHVDFDTTTTIAVAADSNSPNNITWGVRSGSITATELGTSAVTNAKIASNAVQTAELNNDAVTTAKLASDAVTGAKIADDSVDSEHYVDGSIDTVHISADAITNALIADDAVDTAQLADDAVTSANIADNAITNALMADDAIGIAELSATGTASSTTYLRGDNTWATVSGGGGGGTTVTVNGTDEGNINLLTSTDITVAAGNTDPNNVVFTFRDSSVDTVNIADDAVTNAKVADDAIDSGKIADDSINSEHYVDGSIDTAHIADDQITRAKLGSDLTSANLGLSQSTDGGLQLSPAFINSAKVFALEMGYSLTDAAADLTGNSNAGVNGSFFMSTNSSATDVATLIGADNPSAWSDVRSIVMSRSSADSPTRSIAGLLSLLSVGSLIEIHDNTSNSNGTRNYALWAITGFTYVGGASGAATHSLIFRVENALTSVTGNSNLDDYQQTPRVGLYQNNGTPNLTDGRSYNIVVHGEDRIKDGRYILDNSIDYDKLNLGSTPTDGQFVTYNTTTGGFGTSDGNTDFSIDDIEDAVGSTKGTDTIGQMVYDATSTSNNISINDVQLRTGGGGIIGASGEYSTARFMYARPTADTALYAAFDRLEVGSQIIVRNTETALWDNYIAYDVLTVAENSDGIFTVTFGSSNLVSSNGSLPSTISASTTVDVILTPAPLDEKFTDGREITPDTIETDKLEDSAVTSVKIAADAINGSKIADDSIDSEHYVDGSIDTAHLSNNSVTPDKTDIGDTSVIPIRGTWNSRVSSAPDANGEIRFLDSSDADIAAGAQMNTVDTVVFYATDSAGFDHSETFADLTSDIVLEARLTSGVSVIMVRGAATWDATNSRLTIALASGASLYSSALTMPTALTGTWNVLLKRRARLFVTNADILNSTIESEKLASNSVTSAKIADNAVTLAKMSDDSVGLSEINTTNTGATGNVLTRTATALEWSSGGGDFLGALVVIDSSGQEVGVNQIAWVSSNEVYVNTGSSAKSDIDSDTDWSSDSDWVRISGGGAAGTTVTANPSYSGTNQLETVTIGSTMYHTVPSQTWLTEHFSDLDTQVWSGRWDSRQTTAPDAAGEYRIRDDDFADITSSTSWNIDGLRISLYSTDNPSSGSDNDLSAIWSNLSGKAVDVWVQQGTSNQVYFRESTASLSSGVLTLTPGTGIPVAFSQGNFQPNAALSVRLKVRNAGFVSGDEIAPGSIPTLSIADDAVTSDKVDSTIVVTTGAQTVAGNKTFSDDFVVNDNVTLGTASSGHVGGRNSSHVIEMNGVVSADGIHMQNGHDITDGLLDHIIEEIPAGPFTLTTTGTPAIGNQQFTFPTLAWNASATLNTLSTGWGIEGLSTPPANWSEFIGSGQLLIDFTTDAVATTAETFLNGTSGPRQVWLRRNTTNYAVFEFHGSNIAEREADAIAIAMSASHCKLIDSAGSPPSSSQSLSGFLSCNNSGTFTSLGSYDDNVVRTNDGFVPFPVTFGRSITVKSETTFTNVVSLQTTDFLTSYTGKVRTDRFSPLVYFIQKNVVNASTGAVTTTYGSWNGTTTYATVTAIEAAVTFTSTIPT